MNAVAPLLLCLLTPLFSGTVALAVEPQKVMLVLDASGSMWGQVRGEPKVEIARRVIPKLLAALPEGTELGLVAYGHGAKGDCDDIELLIPPGPIDQASFLEKVQGIVPKGKTPLTDAVVFAAEKLKYTEEKATVILVSDGIETCGKDPCEAAEQLEALGIDFVAHVIAFDLSSFEAKSIECIASRTGGRFLPANDAASLGDAFEMVAQQTAAPLAEDKPEPTPEPKLDPATLEVPKTVPAGAVFEVIWSGPNGEGDYITIVPAEADEGTWENFAYTRKGSPLELDALIEPQEAEVRYLSGRGRAVLGRAPITITPIEVSLSAAETAVAGEEVDVAWVGPNYKGDYITVVAAGSGEGAYNDYAYTAKGNPAEVSVPVEVGDFEIRYVSGQGGETLASRPMKITEALVTLEAPAEVVAGASVPVTWTGPDNKGDYITIVAADAEEGSYNRYEYTRRGSPMSVEAPVGTGPHEIRYVSGQGGKTLAKQPIVLNPASASLEAPDEVFLGSEVAVKWTGPDHKGDYITIVMADAEEGKYNRYAYTRNGNPAEVEAPVETGEAEIRYVTGQGGKTLVSRPIRLTTPEVTLDAPAKVPVGGKFEVKWTGPDNPKDYLTIAPADSAEGTYLSYAYTKNGTPAEIAAPDQPGKYEIRYVTGQGDKTLGSRPIEVIRE